MAEHDLPLTKIANAVGFARARAEVSPNAADPLTGLASRREIENRLDTILTTRVGKRQTCAVLMIALTRLDLVNHKLGFEAGDEVLRQVGQRLRRFGLCAAEAGRWGGDEILIINPDCDDRGLLGELALKVIHSISRPYLVGSDQAIIGAAIGIAIAPDDGPTRQELTSNAASALKAARKEGQSQFRCYSAAQASAVERREQLERDFPDALKSGQLAMAYQPIVRSQDYSLIGFEAELRWTHPLLGPISPQTVLSLAETTNLSTSLGEWAIECACRDAAAWPGKLGVSVKVSAAHFMAGPLSPQIAQILNRTDLAAERLEIQLTSEALLGEEQAGCPQLQRLRELGVRVALAEFGTGNSSLGLLQLPLFDRIKIDHSFVRKCCEPNSPKAAIIGSITALARKLGLETTAEGVEAQDELALVRSLGVSMVQGLIFSRALPQEAVQAKLASGDFTCEPIGPERRGADRRKMCRLIGVIHERHRYEAMLRNLSSTGALIEGLLNVPVGTELLLDLGSAQMAVATVRRSQDATQGVEFAVPLVSDGGEGLITRQRVTPDQQPVEPPPRSQRRFVQVDLSARSTRAA